MSAGKVNVGNSSLSPVSFEPVEMLSNLPGNATLNLDVAAP